MQKPVRVSLVAVLAILFMMSSPVGAVAKTKAGPEGRNATAPASSDTTLAGWIGECYINSSNPWTHGGWCDGNGPDWTYRGVVHCTDGVTYFGVMRWAGDRRRSYARCEFSRGVWGGVYVFYQGYYRYSVVRAM